MRYNTREIFDNTVKIHITGSGHGNENGLYRFSWVIYNYSPKWRWIVQGYSPRREASRWISLHYSPTLRWIIVLAYTFLLFFGTAASFNKKVFRHQLSNENATPFCFGPKVNSAVLFQDTQPIKLQKNHYSDLEYMLMKIDVNHSPHFPVLEPTSDPFVADLSRKLCEINVFVRGKYGPLCCLVDVLGAQAMLEIHPRIPENLMAVMTDQTVVPHVSLISRIIDF